MFNMQDQPFSFLQLTDVEIQPLEINIDSTPFDLSLEITKTEKDLIVSARYNTDIFEHITIRHMLEYYQVLLEAVVRNPTQLISTLPGLS